MQNSEGNQNQVTIWRDWENLADPGNGEKYSVARFCCSSSFFYTLVIDVLFRKFTNTVINFLKLVVQTSKRNLAINLDLIGKQFLVQNPA